MTDPNKMFEWTPEGPSLSVEDYTARVRKEERDRIIAEVRAVERSMFRQMEMKASRELKQLIDRLEHEP